MSKYDYSELQNGSDIRGVALPGVEGEPVNLDETAVERLAKGFVVWLKGETGMSPSDMTIAVGRDSRLSGESLSKLFSDSIVPYGVKVLDCDLASTPAMFMSTVFDGFNADGAVMITASHLPFNRNGLKFFSRNGGLDKGDITDIVVFAESDYILSSIEAVGAGEILHADLMDRYSRHLRELIIDGVGADHPLDGLKIAVDAGNGAGGFYATQVLEPLGADISASQFLEPDGNFPNHAPNPENEAAMAALTTAVTKGSCDLGLIFDTDVDRSSAVDENGHEINRNGIVAMAAILIADDHPGTTVVTDSITSDQLTEFLENQLGLKHLRFKRGYRNVINKAIELNESGIDSQLAIETSGHAAYKNNYFLDDGAYLATKIVIKAALLHKDGKKVSSILSDLAEPAEAKEIRIPVKADDFAAYAGNVLEAVKAYVVDGKMPGASLVEPNYEGIRVKFEGDVSGWFLLRKSLHDPLMPMNIESNEAGGCEKIYALIEPLLKEYDKLEI